MGKSAVCYEINFAHQSRSSRQMSLIREPRHVEITFILQQQFAQKQDERDKKRRKGERNERAKCLRYFANREFTAMHNLRLQCAVTCCIDVTCFNS